MKVAYVVLGLAALLFLGVLAIFADGQKNQGGHQMGCVFAALPLLIAVVVLLIGLWLLSANI